MKVTGCCIVYSKGLSEYLDIPLLEVVLTCNPMHVCVFTPRLLGGPSHEVTVVWKSNKAL